MKEVKINMVRHTVCGSTIDERTAKIKSEHMGRTYYFCEESCRVAFEKNPQKFVIEHSKHARQG